MLVIAPFIELINKAMRLNTYVELSAVDLSRHPVFGTRVLPEFLDPLRLKHCFSKLKLVIMASNHNQNKSLEWKYLCTQAILCESGIEWAHNSHYGRTWRNFAKIDWETDGKKIEQATGPIAWRATGLFFWCQMSYERLNFEQNR